MGFRFHRSIKLLPGVRINLSRRGVSTTIGMRGASVNVGPRGTYLNTGLPGTGISSRTRLDSPEAPEAREQVAEVEDSPAIRAPAPHRRVWPWFVLGILVGVMAMLVIRD